MTDESILNVPQDDEVAKEEDSILDLALSDLEDERALPEGTEVKVRVCRKPYISTKEETGNKSIVLWLETPEEANTKDIVHALVLPNGKDKKQDERRRRDVKKAADAFGVAYQGDKLDISEFYEKEAWAVLTYTVDPKYGEQNKIGRFTGTSS